MPRSKSQSMSRRRNPDDAASKALLESVTREGEAEEQNQEDDPFLDEDGDLKVVPTYEDLSTLVDGSSVHALPMQEILRRNLRVTLRAIEMAEIAYHANPRQGTSTALTQMQKLSQELIAAIEAKQDPEELREEIMEKIIKPMILEFIKILTSEAERKRATFLTLVDDDRQGIVAHEMKDLLKGVSTGMDEAYENSGRQLAELLGANKKKKSR